MNQKPSFEDGLLVCLDIIQKSKSLEDAKDRIYQLLDAYKETEHSGRVEMIKNQLGIWGIL